MSRKLLLLMFYIFSLQQVFCQQIVNSKITNEKDVEGIHIINTQSKEYAITNASGEFSIRAKIDDTLSILAIQYKEMKLPITVDILKKEILTVTLEEIVHQLDEVVIGNTLSGNLIKDIEGIEIEKISLPSLNYSWDQISKVKFDDDRVPLRNTITTKGQLVDGINFVAIGKLLFSAIKKKKNKRIDNTPPLVLNEDYVHTTFGADVFQETLKIPEDNVTLFMLYCTNNEELLKYFNEKNEIKLLEQLIKLSHTFKETLNED